MATPTPSHHTQNHVHTGNNNAITNTSIACTDNSVKITAKHIPGRNTTRRFDPLSDIRNAELSTGMKIMAWFAATEYILSHDYSAQVRRGLASLREDGAVSFNAWLQQLVRSKQFKCAGLKKIWKTIVRVKKSGVDADLEQFCSVIIHRAPQEWKSHHIGNLAILLDPNLAKMAAYCTRHQLTAMDIVAKYEKIKHDVLDQQWTETEKVFSRKYLAVIVVVAGDQRAISME